MNCERTGERALASAETNLCGGVKVPKVVGIRFKPAHKVYYFDPTGFEDLKTGEYVVVETNKGLEVGRVVIPPREVSKDRISKPLKGIKRRATAWDLTQMDYHKRQEPEALEKCRRIAKKLGLPIKVVGVEYSFDGSRLTVYFTAESRLDLKEFTKALSKELKTRIELHQLGVRDETKLLGGIGPCGRILCCASFLSEFTSISIKMAKLQDLPINPTAISGLCNRLLCCLSYESEVYKEAKERLPKVGQKVKTPHGIGEVTSINIIKETVTVRLESEATAEVPADQVESITERAE